MAAAAKPIAPFHHAPTVADRFPPIPALSASGYAAVEPNLRASPIVAGCEIIVIHGACHIVRAPDTNMDDFARISTSEVHVSGLQRAAVGPSASLRKMSRKQFRSFSVNPERAASSKVSAKGAISANSARPRADNCNSTRR